MLDLIIRGGTVIDDTSGVPFRADVGTHDSKIAAAGTDLGTAWQEIDATEQFAAPGGIDIVTHYDDQATWGSERDPSFSSGVTTIVGRGTGTGQFVRHLEHA